MLSTWAAFLALTLTIFLIFKKVHPVYALIIGPVVGSLAGGLTLQEILPIMVEGSKNMIPAVLRILAAGILAGVLIDSGAATKLAKEIVRIFGNNFSILALALSTMLLTSIGVFVDVAVITVAPIALATAKKSNISVMAVLLAMIGGGKSGNIISPNPNAIAITEGFSIELYSLMTAGIIPAIIGLIFTVWVSKKIEAKHTFNLEFENQNFTEKLPSFYGAISGPLVAILLLAARPTIGIQIDPIFALPIGGIVGCIAMKKINQLNAFALTGLSKMGGVAILLIGTGALSGIISYSELKSDFVLILEKSGLPYYSLASLSGIFLSGATASTTSGSALATSIFGTKLISSGISGVAAGAMIHAGATVLDHLPHGSFFYATGGSVGLKIKDRMKLIPFESAIGIIITIVSILIWK